MQSLFFILYFYFIFHVTLLLTYSLVLMHKVLYNVSICDYLKRCTLQKVI